MTYPTNEQHQVDVPYGMAEVSREAFWRRVRSETRNIHPSSERFHTDWMFLGTRSAWGWTSHGYATAHDAEPERFALANVGAQP